MSAAHLHLASAPHGAVILEPAPARIRVLLADDHALVRRSLRLLLDGEDDLDVVGEAESIGSVVRNVHGHTPNVLVLDLQMPGGSSNASIAGPRPRSSSSEGRRSVMIARRLSVSSSMSSIA